MDLGDDAHPNSAVFDVARGDERIRDHGVLDRWRPDPGPGDRRLRGGSFRIAPAIVVVANDVPGTVARITGLIADRGLNVATVRVDRTGRGERALMTIETDEDVPDDVLAELAGQEWVHWIRNVHQLNA